MLTRDELRQRIRDILAEEQIDEATNSLPALLTLRRGAIRTLSDGRKIAEYHHVDSGIILIFPMIFSKGDKQ
jgi:hypothetical protein